MLLAIVRVFQVELLLELIDFDLKFDATFAFEVIGLE